MKNLYKPVIFVFFYVSFIFLSSCGKAYFYDGTPYVDFYVDNNNGKIYSCWDSALNYTCLIQGKSGARIEYVVFTAEIYGRYYTVRETLPDKPQEYTMQISFIPAQFFPRLSNDTIMLEVSFSALEAKTGIEFHSSLYSVTLKPCRNDTTHYYNSFNPAD